jgi:CRP-like cAMP-binding protein
VRSIAPATTATGPLAGAFFAPLPPRNRAAVLQRFRRRMVIAGTTVIRSGEAGHGLVVIVRGQLELRAGRADGAWISVGALAAGEFIGEASLLARQPAAVQVVAETDAELLVLAPDDFYDLIRAFPVLRAELESVAARRARVHQQRLSE